MGYLVDAAVILAYFTLVIGVGLASARKRGRNMREFAVGSRQLPWWAVLGSLVAAELSAATFLGTPGEGYHLRNFTYAQLAIGVILARIIVACLFIRPFYDNNVVSIYEYLQLRFGKATRNAASIVFLLTRLLASGTRLYVAAVVVVLGYEMIHGTTPTTAQTIWIYGGAVVFVTALTTVYTAAGGIRAVVWTDVIQATVMGGAVIYALASLWNGVGGWDHVFGAQSVLNQKHDLQIFDGGSGFDGSTPSSAYANAHGHTWLGSIYGVLGNEYTIWAAILGSTFTTMATHGTDQDMVQRMLTAKNKARSRLALIMSGLADVPIAFGFLFIGVLLAVFYQLHPDPHLPVKNPEIFAYYILHRLPAGARGLLIAGVLATAMGSLSTALNALATSFTEDFWVPYFARSTRPEHVVRAVRGSTIVFAVLLAAVGTATAAVVVYSPHARIIPVVLGVFGYTYGSLLGVFLLGLTTKNRGNDLGNLLGMIAGFIGVAILSGLPWDLINAVRGQSSDIGPGVIHMAQAGLLVFKDGYVQAPDWLVQIEFPWRVMFGTIITYAVASCFARHKPLPTPPR
jgi:SSS family solute:Na+ symporter